MGLITVAFLGSLSGDRTETFVVPDGVTALAAIGVGAGGRGGSAQGAGARGGGGAGGAFARAEAIAVTPGESLTVFVPTTNTGTDGPDSTLSRGATTLLRAKGGQGGGNATGGSPSGAAGIGSTTGSVGDVSFAGGDGSAGVGSMRTGAGGGGAGTNGEGGDASGVTAGTGTADYGGGGGPGSTSGVGSVGVNGSAYGGAGSGGRANDATLRTGGVGARGVVVLFYEAPDLGPNVTTAVQCDAFTGGDDADIDARLFDGCGTSGTASWNADDGYNTAGDHLFIQAGEVTGDHAREIQVLVDDAPCTAENFQGARAYLRFPNYDVPSTPDTCDLLWEDDFDGAAGELAGRAHNGGSLGTGTWVRDDGGTGPGIELDGTGRVYHPGGGSGVTAATYRISGLTGLPADYDVEIDVERTSFMVSGQSIGSVGVPVRMQVPGSPNGELNYWYLYSTSEDPPTDDNKHGLWSARTGGPIGTLITGSASADPPGDHGINVGETRTIRVKVRGTTPGVCTTYIYDGVDENGAACAGGRIGITYFDGMFGAARKNYNTGPPGLRMSVQSNEGSYRVKAIRIIQFTAGSSSFVFTDGYAYVNLRTTPWSGTANGYQVVLEGVRDGPGNAFQLYVYMWVYTGGVFVQLRVPQLIGNSIPIDQSLIYVLEATIEDDAISGNPTIYARVNGVLVQRFDLITDIPDGSTTVLPGGSIHTGGQVGLGVYDEAYEFNHAQRNVLCSRYEVLCDDCSGDNGGGGGGGGGGGVGVKMPVWNGTIWEDTCLEQVMDGGVWTPVAEGWEYDGSLWIPLEPCSNPEVNGDPGRDTSRLGCVGQIPVPGVGLDPLGARFFFCYDLPTQGATDPFDASAKSLATSYVDSVLDAAAAAGLRILGTQGGYAKFRTGGVYDPDEMDTYIAGFASHDTAMHAKFTAGVFPAMQVIDDHYSVEDWGAVILGTEVNRICSVWKAQHSWLPVGVRATGTRLNDGSSYPDVDFSICQYSAKFGDPATWMANELSILSGLGIPSVFFSLNFLNGGPAYPGALPGPSGTMFTPQAVIDVGSVLAAESASSGFGGWRYSLNFLNQSVGGLTMADALATVRNILAAV